MMDNSPSILFVTSDLGKGGAQTLTVRLANAFASKGYSTKLLLFKCKGPNKSNLSEAVDLYNLNVDPYNWLSLLYAILKIPVYIHTISPSLTLSNHPRKVNVIVSLSVFLSGKITNLVLVEQNALIKSHRRKDKTLLKRLKWTFIHYVYSIADNLVAVSECVKSDMVELLRLNSGDISVINNPSLPNEIQDENYKFDVDIPIEETADVIVGAGRLTEQKGFDTLIDAYSMLSDIKNTRLLILGDGPLDTQLKKRAYEHEIEASVTFTGYVNNPYMYFDYADIFVLSSRWEGFPTVLVEAMAFDCKIVSTNCRCGPSEILEDGKWGKLVPVGNPEARSTAIKKCLNNSTTDISVSQRASMFTVEVAFREYEKLVKEFFSRSHDK